MKKTLILTCLLIIGTISGCTAKEENMIVESTGIVNGIIDNKFGGHGTDFNQNGVPTYSLPFQIKNPPTNAICYALVLEDKDAYPVTNGFSWIHWTAANIKKTELNENQSQTSTDFVQGQNSWISDFGGNQSAELSSYYGGMMPPDNDHIYELHVFALDKELDLENGFMLNDLYREMDGHIIDSYTLKGKYPKLSE